MQEISLMVVANLLQHQDLTTNGFFNELNVGTLRFMVITIISGIPLDVFMEF